MNRPSQSIPYILGLDLGANSLGWSIIGLVEDQPACIVDAGVRIFPEAVDKLESGRDEPKNAQRRAARQMRRQTDRRARRLASCFKVLQRFHLLPSYPEAADPNDPLSRDSLIKELDLKLEAELPGLIDPANPHLSRSVLLYRLRALALDHDLPPYAVGRIFFHIAQRRGFKSGRLQEVKEESEKELGQVQSKIQSVEDAIKSGEARTIGEYWSKQPSP